MEYNIGDKFLCINNFVDVEILFTKGKYYIISDYYSYESDIKFFLIGNDKEEYYFLINDIISPYYLYNYFKDIRKDRKDKLLNLKKDVK